MANLTFAWVVHLAIYLLGSRLAMRWLSGAPREMIMALLSLGGIFYFYFNCAGLYDFHLRYDFRFFVCYIMVVIFQYTVLALCADAKGGAFWPAFWAPIGALLVFRCVPDSAFVILGRVIGNGLADRRPVILGMSYLAFRCSRLAVEVQNGSVKRPRLWEYLNFAFFLPTISVGPINTYASFRRGFESAPWKVPAGRAIFRILVGLVKFQFLSLLCNRLAYEGLLFNGHLHPWVHLPMAMIFYYLYLYCNFSGFCDMAIGTAAWIGIPVPENFHNPFAARNLKEFWNRWHITLSQWMRDLVFAPVSKYLVRVMGLPLANHAIAIAITIVFLLVGVWHGAGWNFAIFGLIHALGLVANHYYTIGLKKWLGREGFAAYMANRWIHAAAVALTFMYCAASLLFFANTLPQIREIFRILR